MAVSASDFLVFEKYKNAGPHAFSNKLVSEADEDSYARIFEGLRASVHNVVSATEAGSFDTWNCRFGREGGIQGQRPLDLWASIINAHSEAFSKFPQVYAIASEIGVEIGFSVSIHEDDYFNQEIKRRNRVIVPILNRKLPSPDSDTATTISSQLALDPAWKFGQKTRQGPQSSFATFSDLLAYLKGAGSSPKGGGSVYKLLTFNEIAETEDRLTAELVNTFGIFRPLMERLKANSVEVAVINDLTAVCDFAEGVPDFDPDNDADGKKKVLRQIAIRQGQARFREALMDAYGGRCALTGCSLGPILQAAHIAPYNGSSTNHVMNGLLLRADIHTLFDLGLLRIDPDTLRFSAASDLSGTEYEQFDGCALNVPAKPSHRPSKTALIKKRAMFPTL